MPVSDAAPAVAFLAVPVSDAAPAVAFLAVPVSDAVSAVAFLAVPVSDAAPAVAFLAVLVSDAAPVVAFAVEPGVLSVAAELGVSFVVAESQVSVDIVVVFFALVPFSGVVVEVDSSGRPKYCAFPNVDYYSSSSSFVEVAARESVDSPIGVRTSYGLCSILSNPGQHQNKNLEHFYNNASRGHNNAIDTNGLPRDATTNHSRKIFLPQYQEQHRHTYQVSLLALEVRKMR